MTIELNLIDITEILRRDTMTNLNYYGFYNLDFLNTVCAGYYISYVSYKSKHGGNIPIITLSSSFNNGSDGLRDKKVKWLLQEVEHSNVPNTQWVSNKDNSLYIYQARHAKKSYDDCVHSVIEEVEKCWNNLLD